jgi:uncharacterized membrane protein
VLVARPAAVVFSFIATPENDPLWVHVCAAIHRPDDRPIRIGSRLVEQVRCLGFRMRYEWEVTRFDSEGLIQYSSRTGIVPLRITIRVEPRGNHARVTQRIVPRLPRWLPLSSLVSRSIARREARRNLTTLKSRLESAMAKKDVDEPMRPRRVRSLDQASRRS